MTGPTPAELRELFLFESLDEEQLGWLAERGERRTYGAGAPVYTEGEPQVELFVLLDGALRMSRLFAGEQVVLVETDLRGVYSGAVRAYVSQESDYENSVTTTAPSSFFVLPAADFSTFMHRWYPMAVHLLDGLFLGVRNSEATIRSREQLARLGALSANLAHELNNPAGAAVRATGQLRDRVAALRDQLAMIARGRVQPETLARLVACQQAAVELAAAAAPASALQEADLEDELADRMTAAGVASPYELAGVFAGAGLDGAWLERVVAEIGADPLDADPLDADSLDKALHWLATSLETEQLLDEIEEATGRISGLVAAVKQYSYLDSSSVQEVDVHAGLDATVTMLGHKLSGVHVRREYDRDLPRVPAYAAELNQVWTNLIDNAADAMAGGGRLVLRTRRDGEDLLVEVQDDGPGIPEAVRSRVFDAFFTTKGVGKGTGLGLDNARRIVERRHRGSLRLTTGPAGTTFAVRLPLVQSLV